MARIRTVKPEFWTSEQLVECSIPARLLFIGLWNFCDDKGRIVDSAKRIKMSVYPGDDFTPEDIHGMLTELYVNGLIIRYTVDSKEYIQITGWHHQKINKANPSKLPEPPLTTTGTLPEPHPPEGKGREGNGREERDKPNGLLSSAQKNAEDDPPENDVIDEEKDDEVLPTNEIDKAYYNFNITAEGYGLPVALALTPARRTKLRQRLKEIGGMPGWNKALDNLERSDFCKGKNDRGWRADLDFMLQPKSLMRLLEGGYQNHRGDDMAKTFALIDERQRQADKAEATEAAR